MVASADTMSPRCLLGVIIRPPANKHHGEVTGQVTRNDVPSYESTFLHRGVRGVLPGWPAAPKFFVVVLPMAKKSILPLYCAHIRGAWSLTVVFVMSCRGTRTWDVREKLQHALRLYYEYHTCGMGIQTRDTSH